MHKSHNMTVTGDERPGHRVLPDDVIGLCGCSNTSTLEVAVGPKCDMAAEKLIDNEIVTEAVRPKRDMDSEEPIDKEIEKDAVRPKSDMDAEKSAKTANENDAVCPKCDGESAAVDENATNKQEKNANEGAAAAKKKPEENDEVTSENVEIGRLIEERRNTV